MDKNNCRNLQHNERTCEHKVGYNSKNKHTKHNYKRDCTSYHSCVKKWHRSNLKTLGMLYFLDEIDG